MKSWHLDLVIEDASQEQANELFDEVIALVSSKGLIVGGGIHLFGDITKDEECQGCLKEFELPKGELNIREPWHLPENVVLQGG